ncbi:hypothetical protein MMA231_04299 (plasmid) [Asticcacaulis sp. MM231]
MYRSELYPIMRLGCQVLISELVLKLGDLVHALVEDCHNTYIATR